MSDAPPKTDRVTQVLVVLLLGGAVMMGWREVKDDRLLNAAAPAPDFTLEAVQGPPLTLSSLKGQVVVLDFWASWCGPCREEMPMLLKVARERAPEGVRLVAINNDDLDTQREAVAAFMKGEPSLGPHAVYGTPEVGHRYQVRVLPTVYVVDRHGDVVTAEAGQVSEVQLKRWIDQALARP